MIKNSWRLTVFAAALILVMTACTTAGDEPGVTAEQGTESASSSALPVVTVPTETNGVTEGAQSLETAAQDDAPVNGIVEVTPMSAEELATQPPGQTEPGGGDMPDGEQTDPGDTQPLPPAGWSAYSNPELGFGLVYPANFVTGAANAAIQSQLIPTPTGAIYFVDPAVADSAFAGTDAPDLEVRYHATDSFVSLDDWLRSTGIVTEGDGKSVTPYQTALVSGLEVCESTMVFPPCSTFIAGVNQVFQLRSVSLEGEAMAESFYLLGQ